MKLYPNLIKLKNYTPKTLGFTSNEEMKMISDTLQLDEATEDDLYNYRTLVVCMWGDMIEKTTEESSRERNLMDAMQSITAVLDEKMAMRGMEV